MNINEIIQYIVDQGVQSYEKNTDEHDLAIDFVDIFAKDETDFEKLTKIAESISTVIDKTKTGDIRKLNNPVETKAGKLRLMKIRVPDKSKPYRGAPDFKIKSYENFKNKYLNQDKFSLIVRPDYEMIELKDDDFDVLVYFLNNPLSDCLNL